MPSKEEWEGLKRRAKVLRSVRISHEDIAAQLSSDEVRLMPWTIYAWCNEAKTANRSAPGRRSTAAADHADAHRVADLGVLECGTHVAVFHLANRTHTGALEAATLAVDVCVAHHRLVGARRPHSTA